MGLFGFGGLVGFILFFMLFSFCLVSCFVCVVVFVLFCLCFLFVFAALLGFGWFYFGLFCFVFGLVGVGLFWFCFVMFVPQIAIAIRVLISNRGKGDDPPWWIGRGHPACHCRVQWWCHCWVPS